MTLDLSEAVDLSVPSMTSVPAACLVHRETKSTNSRAKHDINTGTAVQWVKSRSDQFREKWLCLITPFSLFNCFWWLDSISTSLYFPCNISEILCSVLICNDMKMKPLLKCQCQWSGGHSVQVRGPLMNLHWRLLTVGH